MRLFYKKTFTKQYQNLPPVIKKRTGEKLNLLLSNFHHPSLQTKKMKGHEDIWEVKISRSYRFTLQIKGDAYILRKIGKHEILRKP